MKAIPAYWGKRCYLPDGHDGECRVCAACEGDPEALGMHVCGMDNV